MSHTHEAGLDYILFITYQVLNKYLLNECVWTPYATLDQEGHIAIEKKEVKILILPEFKSRSIHEYLPYLSFPHPYMEESSFPHFFFFAVS